MSQCFSHWLMETSGGNIFIGYTFGIIRIGCYHFFGHYINCFFSYSRLFNHILLLLVKKVKSFVFQCKVRWKTKHCAIYTWFHYELMLCQYYLSCLSANTRSSQWIDSFFRLLCDGAAYANFAVFFWLWSLVRLWNRIITFATKCHVSITSQFNNYLW